MFLSRNLLVINKQQENSATLNLEFHIIKWILKLSNGKVSAKDATYTILKIIETKNHNVRQPKIDHQTHLNLYTPSLAWYLEMFNVQPPIFENNACTVSHHTSNDFLLVWHLQY